MKMKYHESKRGKLSSERKQRVDRREEKRFLEMQKAMVNELLPANARRVK